mmetsp:Transcript_18516/g.44379  ORF Transcript_18516/g.44379 Transcript_18516/m.44379 type:complete len:305 (-) Transcript_18516:177-1091(-)
MSRVGCVIEAMPDSIRGFPSACVLVEPNGKVSLHSTHDQMWTPDFAYVGSISPQSSAHYEALKAAAAAVGKSYWEKKMFGFFSLDFISLTDSEGLPRLWAIDLNVGLSDAASSFELFNFISGGELDVRDGHYYVGGDDDEDTSTIATSATPAPSEGQTVWAMPPEDRNVAQRRFFVTADFLFHPNLASVQYSVFFNLCRLKGVHFDLQDRVGTAFVLVDSFASGVLGLLAVGRSELPALRFLADALDFIQLQLGVARGQGPKYLPQGAFLGAVTEVKAQIDRRSKDKEGKSKRGSGKQGSMVAF